MRPGVSAYGPYALAAVAATVAALAAFSAGAQEPAPPAPPAQSVAERVDAYKHGMGHVRLQLPSVSLDALRAAFKRIDYALDSVREHGEVPPLFLASLPQDLTDIRVPNERKAVFIKTALPLILYVNREISHQRLRLHYLRVLETSGVAMAEEDRAWLDDLRDRYDPADDSITALLRHIDIIPPSLALAQAAEESGWGTSRFAREGNALFGQRIWHGDGGLLPLRREVGERHRVRRFDRLIEAVAAYAFNLNSHPSYEAFRRLRERMRHSGRGLDGQELAETLTAYSERREAYVATIRTIMRVNGLEAFDRARLGDRFRIDIVSPDA